ncbi:GLUG motif-containing protein, partial [Parasporobacterium paucivorans]
HIMNLSFYTDFSISDSLKTVRKSVLIHGTIILAGYARGNITACYSTGTISGGNNASTGGLVGYNRGGIIKNSFSSATVQAGNASGGGYTHAGGFAGYQYPGLIINCYAMGDVSAGNASGRYSCVATGGFIGGNNGRIENVYCTGDVLAGTAADSQSSVEPGAFAGYNDLYGTISLAYYRNLGSPSDTSGASGMEASAMQTQDFALLLTGNRSDPAILEPWMQIPGLNEDYPLFAMAVGSDPTNEQNAPQSNQNGTDTPLISYANTETGSDPAEDPLADPLEDTAPKTGIPAGPAPWFLASSVLSLTAVLVAMKKLRR